MILQRFESTDQGTFGHLGSWFTGELPWRNNAAQVSCIPADIYQVAWTWSPRLRRLTYRVLAVPGRSGVLIHSSNLMGDASLGFRAQLQGCISLGERLGRIDGQKALLISRPAVRAFEDMMGRRPFELEIRDA